MTGFSDVLVGLQYGDEGKAKIVDAISAEYDIVARFNGGANAGHTVVTDALSISLAQVPSAVFHGDKLLYIGSGCAVSIEKLAQEIQQLEAVGVQLKNRLFVSGKCSVVQPVHLMQDQENRSKLGSTGNGIGPCYADRAIRMRRGSRVNIQICDMLNSEHAALALMRENWIHAVQGDHAAATEPGTEPGVEVDLAIKAMKEAWSVVAPYVTTDSSFLVSRVTAGARVLFEGAQSVLLDVVHGDQPFVTASHTLPSYAYVGGDLPCKFHRKTIGIAKAIVSRVGSGPFPSELGGARSATYCSEMAGQGAGRDEESVKFDAKALLKGDDDFGVGLAIRMMTGEYGTNSGRPRRIGLLDLVQLKRALDVSGTDELILNKCDCLELFSQSKRKNIPVVTGYNSSVVGRELIIKAFPPFTIEPENSSGQLPDALSEFLRFVESQLGCRITAVGTGPTRDHLVFLSKTPRQKKWK